jgi:hypothetical protein
MLRSVRIILRAALAFLFAFQLIAPAVAAPMFAVSGSVRGLHGTVFLQLNLGNDVSVTSSTGAGAPFAFDSVLASGSTYSVSIKTQPMHQKCVVDRGKGKVGSTNVTGVAVNCADDPPPDPEPVPDHIISGTVSGLTGSVVLENNGGDDLTVSANGGFTFATRIATGAPYAVSVRTHPSTPPQNCTLANATGTVTDDVTNIAVTCATLPTLTGLTVQPNVRAAFVSWTSPVSGSTFNVYSSSAPNCDVRNYSLCPDGTLALTGQTPNRNVTDLRNRQRYYFKVETTFPNGVRALSNEVSTIPDAWVFDGDVLAVATGPTGIVYVSGNFTTAHIANDGQLVTRNHLAALAPDGTLLAWNPSPDSPPKVILPRADRILVAGSFLHFGSDGSIDKPRLAALEPTTGTVLSWGPTVSDTVQSMAIAGDTLYIGGIFLQVGSTLTNHAAAITLSTGQLNTAFRPEPDGNVFAVAVGPNGVYLGGSFSTIRGAGNTRPTVRNAALVYGDDGVAIPLSNSNRTPIFRPDPDGTVQSLAFSPVSVAGSDAIYLGGQFGNVRGPGTSRVFTGRIAQVYADDGVAITNANGQLMFKPMPDSTVRTIVTSGNNVYFGGAFNIVIAPDEHARAAAFTAFGEPLPWNPSPDFPVNALAVFGTTIYAGGEFTAIGGASRRRFSALDATSGLVTP